MGRDDACHVDVAAVFFVVWRLTMFSRFSGQVGGGLACRAIQLPRPLSSMSRATNAAGLADSHIRTRDAQGVGEEKGTKRVRGGWGLHRPLARYKSSVTMPIYTRSLVFRWSPACAVSHVRTHAHIRGFDDCQGSDGARPVLKEGERGTLRKTLTQTSLSANRQRKRGQKKQKKILRIFLEGPKVQMPHK